MVAFIERFFGAVKNLTRGFTPLSGSKRRREDSDSRELEDQRRSQAARTTQPSSSGEGAWRSSQQATESLAQELPEPFYGRGPAEPPSTFAGFGMAGKVRDLAPRQNSHAVLNGSVEPTPQVPVDRNQQQTQPGWHSHSSNAAPPDCVAGQVPAPQHLFPVGGTTAAVQQRPAQLLARPQQPHMQPQGAAHPPPGARAGVPRPVPAGLVTPGTGPSFGGDPSQFGDQMGTPRQLFKTPESTLRKFGGIRLGGIAPHAPTGAPTAAATAAAGPSRIGDPVPGRGGSHFGPLRATPAAATASAAAVSAGSAAGAAERAALAMPAPPPRAGYMALAYRGQAAPMYQQHQQKLPFAVTYKHSMYDLQTGGMVQTREELQEHLRAYEASRRSRAPAATPLREDGGYVAGDDEDDDDKRRSALAQDARTMVDRLRSGLAAATRQAGSNPKVAAAAVCRQATRAALEATQAARGSDALEAIGLKVAVHDQMVRQVRATAEEETKRSVQAVKADEAAQRAQMEQRQQQLRHELALKMLPPPAAAAAAAALAASLTSRSGPSGSAAAAAPPQPVVASRPASGRRPPAAAAGPPQPRGKQPPPRPAEDDDVLDLVSSDDEEDEEEGAGDEGEVVEDEGDMADPYGVEYGSYPGEEHGGGNSALRCASRAERSAWRRTMDPSADEGEMLVAFQPISVLEIKLPRAKLQCMALGTWLNDEVINLYMLLLQARDTRLRRAAAAAAAAAAARGAAAPAAPPRCHFFNSFFYNKLFQDDGHYNYGNVRRWTTAKQLSNKLQDSSNVLELDRIIMPIHKGIHWTCAEIDLQARAVRYYDSLKDEDHALVRHLLTWVSDESADKLKQRWDTSKWSVEFPKRIPEQLNGCDCGVFSIMFADRRGAGLPLDFTQADMPLLRIKVLHSVVQMRVD